MSIDYTGLQGGTIVQPGSLLRVTFTRILPFSLFSAEGAEMQGAYNKVAELAPRNAEAFVASPFSAAPGADSFTIDVKTSQDGGARTAEAIAASLNSIPLTYSVTRITRVTAGEGSEAASEARSEQSEAEDSEPGALDAIGSVAKEANSTLKLLLWAIIAVVVAYLVFSFIPKKAT